MRTRRLSLTAVAVALVLAVTGCTVPAALGDAPTPTPTRTLLWSTEFDGAAGSLPGGGWNPVEGGQGFGNQELECYTPAPGNASLTGTGELAITAIRQPGHICSDGSSNDYTSAKLTTQNTFQTTYGRLEVRAKVPAGTGTWPAFWALGTDHETAGWPQSGEIDVFETKGGHPATVYGSLHAPKANLDPMYVTGSRDTATDLSQAFHVYAAEWTATSVAFSVDGTVYATITRDDLEKQGGTWVFDKPFYLLLDLAVGGNFTVPPTDDFGASQQLLVDYVRVYG